jgi:hypothetical protein
MQLLIDTTSKTSNFSLAETQSFELSCVNQLSVDPAICRLASRKGVKEYAYTEIAVYFTYLCGLNPLTDAMIV